MGAFKKGLPLLRAGGEVICRQTLAVRSLSMSMCTVWIERWTAPLVSLLPAPPPVTINLSLLKQLR